MARKEDHVCTIYTIKLVYKQQNINERNTNC